MRQSHPLITGFSGIPWGSQAATVKAAAGTPADTLVDDDAEFLVYNQVVLGENTRTEFLLTQDKGLLKGIYNVKLDIGKDCEAIIRKFSKAISERYPLILSDYHRANSSSLPFCDGSAVAENGP